MVHTGLSVLSLQRAVTTSLVHGSHTLFPALKYSHSLVPRTIIRHYTPSHRAEPLISDTVIPPTNNNNNPSSSSPNTPKPFGPPISSQSSLKPKSGKEEPGEIKDPVIIFNTVWNKLEEKYGLENLRYPQEIIWLGGAPGAGKGTNTPFIASVRGITAAPIVMSSLLDTLEARQIKSQGGLVSDSYHYYHF